MAFVVAAGRSPPPTSSSGAGTRWPTTRCRGWSRSSTSSRVNATGKVIKDVLRARAAPAGTGDRDMTVEGAPRRLSAFTGLRVVELGVWVAAPSAGALLADWGADVIKVEPPTGDPDAQRLRLHRHRRGLPEPGLRTRQPGQAECRARPAHGEDRAQLEELLATRRRLPHQPAPRRARHLGLEPDATVGPPSPPRLLQRQRLRPARRGPQPTRLRHRSLLGPLGPLGPVGQQRRGAPQRPGRHRRPHQRSGRLGRPAGRVCSSSARPAGAASSRSRCCGRARTCSGGTSACRRRWARWPRPRRGDQPDAAHEFVPDQGRALVLLHRPRGRPPHRPVLRALGRPDLLDDPRFADATRCAVTAPRSSPSSTRSWRPRRWPPGPSASTARRVVGARPRAGRRAGGSAARRQRRAARAARRVGRHRGPLDQRPDQLLGPPGQPAAPAPRSGSTPTRCWPSSPAGRQLERAGGPSRPAGPGPAGPARSRCAGSRWCPHR